jgi:hypothetical protein
MTPTELLVVIFAGLVLESGCAGSQVPSPSAGNNSEGTSQNAAPAQAVARPLDQPSSPAAQSCDGVACESTSDCCKGYDCGFDPDRSRVQRYCLGS